MDEGKKDIVRYEKLKVQQLQNYEQYGGKGFFISSEPSPLVVFFKSNRPERKISHIDTSENLDVYSRETKKGSDKFFGGFSDFLMLWGGFFALYLGMTVFMSIKDLQFFKRLKYVVITVFKRLFIVNALFFMLYALAVAVALLMGVRFSASECKVLFGFILYTLVLLSAFYLGGFFISIFTLRRRNLALGFIALIWALGIVLIPGVSDKFTKDHAQVKQLIAETNLKKLEILMDYEKKSQEKYFRRIKEKDVDIKKLKREIMEDYRKGSLQTIERLEGKLLADLKDKFLRQEYLSLVTLTNYYHYLSGEVAADGNDLLLSFIDYIRKIKRSFMQFYIDNREFSPKTKVEPFFKTDEGYFLKAESLLPKTYPYALGILLLTSTVIFLFSIRKIKSYLKENRKTNFDGPFEFNKVKVGNIYYVYAGNELERDKLFGSLRGDETISIDQINPNHFDPNIKLNNLLSLAQKIENTDTQKVFNYMEQLDIPRETMEKRIEEVPAETFKKFFCALKFANHQNYIIINDYARRSSKDFNQKFRNLLHDINQNERKTILYLGSEMYDLLSIRSKTAEIGKNARYKILEIDNIKEIAL